MSQDLKPNLTVPPFADDGIGGLMCKAAQSYMAEYVFSPDDGADHEPTEFEAVLIEDFWYGLISDERFFGPIRALLNAARAEGDPAAEGDIPSIIERGQTGERLSPAEQSAWTGYELGWKDGLKHAISDLGECFECGHDLNGPYCPACNSDIDAARAEGAPAAEAWRPTHRHVKRGTDYEVVAEGLMQTAVSPGAWDDLPMTIYRGEDGKWWARPTTEFNDGRFAPIAALSPPAANSSGTLTSSPAAEGAVSQESWRTENAAAEGKEEARSLSKELVASILPNNASLTNFTDFRCSHADLEQVVEAAYKRGWNDREGDLITGVDRVYGSPPAPAAEPVAAALSGVGDDFMTSERHHPGYVLIPTAKFEQLVKAEQALGQQPAPISREEIARLVDPLAFKDWQSLHDRCSKNGDDPDEARETADWAHKAACDTARTKADSILARIGSPSPVVGGTT